MTDDIVTQLRFEYASCECSGIRHDCDRCETDKQAADEIERLRAALHIAAGKLSTLPPYTEWHPETIYKALLEDGVEVVRGK